jgi:hypothetical protein
VIPDEAVIAGAAAIQVRLDKTLGLNDLTRAVLEAAAPHLMASGKTERIRAAIKLLYPDEMTPTAKRILEQILEVQQ